MIRSHKKVILLLVILSGILFQKPIYAEDTLTLVERGLYGGLYVSRFNWSADSVKFDDGSVVELADDTGVRFTLGYRFTEKISVQFNGAYYPSLLPEEDRRNIPGTPFYVESAGWEDEDGGYLSLSGLYHYPYKQFLPYIGAGIGMMEVPYSTEDKGGTDIKLSLEVEIGTQYVFTEAIAAGVSLKYLRAGVDEAEVSALSGFTFDIGIQYTFPF